LCASRCAYEIAATGHLPSGTPPRYYQGAGFQQPPATFRGGPENRDACLVGTTQDGVVLAFRGTIPIDQPGLATIFDWFNDFTVILVPGPNLPGLVHEGFLGSLTNLWNLALAEVKSQLALLGAGATVLVTGHSKGGGIAPLAAWRLVNHEDLSVKVVTFAAPKCGNDDFVEAYQQSRIPHIRYEYADDIVPHLPPSGLFTKVLRVLAARDPRFAQFPTLAYQPVGTLNFIDWSGHLVADSPELRLHRIISLLTLIATFKEDVIVADHSIDCGGGYIAAICPTGVCP
jgi:hypothetical protein